jgi:hypothetical protein
MRAASWDEHSSFVCDERMGSETEHMGGNMGVLVLFSSRLLGMGAGLFLDERHNDIGPCGS